MCATGGVLKADCVSAHFLQKDFYPALQGLGDKLKVTPSLLFWLNSLAKSGM